MMTKLDPCNPRRAWCLGMLLGAGALMSGCASSPSTPRSGGEAGGKQSLLTHWSTVTGARVSALPDPLSPIARRPDFSGNLQWISPAAVAARGNYVFVADAGRRKIFRYDTAQQSMTVLSDYASGAMGNIAVASDLSLYVADIASQKVLHFSVDGRLLRSFDNPLEIARPIAVLVDASNGEVLVADSLRNHVVVFNSLGRVLSVLRSDESRSTEAMASGPDGLYLVDRVGRKIVVIARDGRHRYTLGSDILKMPGVVAVDRFNRVFVSDSFDNTIKVFEDGKLLSSFAGGGGVPPSFNRITGLWLEQNMLYVADSVHARIQIFRIAPPQKKAS
jgi:DNA-binding beta-propeller fold protein YncE